MTRDRELGLDAGITRRDLLHGIGVVSLGALASPLAVLAEEPEPVAPVAPDGYPPALGGMRGSHAGSFEVAHERAWAGKTWRSAPLLEDRFDLVVVGAGISGLAAARFYRELAGPEARILLLDNHDDFGGHAKRNELVTDGRAHLAVGGSVFLEYGAYSEAASGLLAALGVDFARLRAKQNRSFVQDPLEIGSGIYFDAASFGEDRLIRGKLLPLARRSAKGDFALAEHVERIPIPAVARRALARFLGERTDYLSDVPDAEKPAALARISYRDFLEQKARLPDAALRVFQSHPAAYWGVGADALSAWDCLEFGMPGWHRLGAFGREAEAQHAGAGMEAESAWFPDGNASIARLLVRDLIPAAAPGTTQEDVVNARFDYAALDRPSAPIRLRLNSTAVHVDPLPADAGIDVTYVRGGRAERIRTRDCVLACYHAMIPHLVPGLPEAQRAALRYGEKAPLLSTNVLLREGSVLSRAGAAAFYCPGRRHSTLLALGPSVGRYEAGWEPSQPVVLHMLAALAKPRPGASLRDQLREGRRELLTLSFADLEREIREHLMGMLGGSGLDPARDVLAITVNRWPHGYAYERNRLFDPEWPEGEAPNEVARRRFGRIAIANSDAAYSAYLDAAIEEAHRAVRELAAL